MSWAHFSQQLNTTTEGACRLPRRNFVALSRKPQSNGGDGQRATTSKSSFPWFD
jgi:hypothetical protein